MQVQGCRRADPAAWGRHRHQCSHCGWLAWCLLGAKCHSSNNVSPRTCLLVAQRRSPRLQAARELTGRQDHSCGYCSDELGRANAQMIPHLRWRSSVHAAAKHLLTCPDPCLTEVIIACLHDLRRALWLRSDWPSNGAGLLCMILSG